MSAINTTISAGISGGVLKSVPSARGTRTYSACPPSSLEQPNSRTRSQRAVSPLRQKKQSILPRTVSGGWNGRE